jgi:thymidine phosphorylase
MNEPLAHSAGNALEVLHAVKFLNGSLTDERVEAITVALGAELLVSAKIASSHEDAESKLKNVLSSGKAAEYFARMVAHLGGPKDFLEKPEAHLKAAPIIRPIFANDDGSVSSIATRDLGLAVIELGGGRRIAADAIDHSVGLSNLLGKNSTCDFENPLCMVHARDEQSFERAAAIVRKAYVIGEGMKSYPPILERIAP